MALRRKALGLFETSGHCLVDGSVGKVFGLRDWQHMEISFVSYHHHHHHYHHHLNYLLLLFASTVIVVLFVVCGVFVRCVSVF
jgi:hypothetical protein